ncbi:nicotinamide mononucleotide transporter [Enterococcus alishanensis]
MKKVHSLLNSKQWDIGWISLGIILVIISTIISSNGNITLATVTSFLGSIIGMTVVLLLANQSGKFATGLGVVGALFDTFNNYMFGLSGMMFVGIYAFFIYLKGFFSLGKQIAVTKVTKSNLIVSLCIAVAGGILLLTYGSTILPNNAPQWVIYCNALVFIIQVVSQYLMVEGKAIGWVGFTVINVINLCLQSYVYISGANPAALVYLAMTFMFLLNSVKALVLWYGFGE